jgi:hypothetical protein
VSSWILADNNFGDTFGGGLAGPTGLVVILLLVIGTVLLIRNMNARLRRLPDHFGDQESEDRATKAQATNAQATNPQATEDGTRSDGNAN